MSTRKKSRSSKSHRFSADLKLRALRQSRTMLACETVLQGHESWCSLRDMSGDLYLETTIASYLTGRPTRDLVVSARQQVTREWWAARRHDFELFTSQIAIDEAAEGDPEYAQKRLGLLRDIPLLAITDEVIRLANRILDSGTLLEKAVRDAAHIAVATVHGMQYLLTWNCKHLANAEIFEKVGRVCALAGFLCPVICTPDELGGE